MPSEPVILNLAATGMVPMRDDTPHVPLTPAEIAEDCALCRELGVSVVHLHAREEDGTPTHRKEAYARIIAAVRERAPDLVVCVSCSGRRVRELEKRSEVLELEGDVKPDMASLTLGSMNFPGQASVNAPDVIEGLARKMADRGIRPELEAFETGMIDVSRYLLRKGILREPLYYNLLLGSRGTAALDPLNVGAMLAALPAGAAWGLAGIGRYQLRANVMALCSGGHVRVGLEDNIWFDEERTTLASNPMLVRRVVDIARALGRRPATPVEARAILGLEA
jgi:uncharacterized protein (DUF849 family)